MTSLVRFSHHTSIFLGNLSTHTIQIFKYSYAIVQLTPPIYYPPDGTYYIYNAQYKRVFDDYGFAVKEDDPIIGWSAHPKLLPPNQQWVVETADNSTDHKVTIRSLVTVQQNPSAGGYAINLDGKIVTSKNTQSWTLQPVPNSCAQFMIVDCNVAITLDDGTINTPSVPETQLTAEAVHKNATNQHWVFVPADQIDEFLKENGTN